MFTPELRAAHEKYENAPPTTKQAIDRAYSEAADVLTKAGLPTANDDRAEALVAALMIYVLESGRK